MNYKAKRMYVEWTEGSPEGPCYNRTHSGWFDHIVFQGWFMSLMLPTLRRQKGTKVLIGDNLSSHISGEVM